MAQDRQLASHSSEQAESDSAAPFMAASLLDILELLSQAALAADGAGGSIERTYNLIEKCREVAGPSPLLVPIYDAILCAAALSRDAKREVERKSETQAFVYFMRRTDKLIKIGYSYDPRGRLNQVRAQCKQEVEILATVQGARKLEKTLHAKFAGQRVEGEWFSESPELLREIALHCKAHAALS